MKKLLLLSLFTSVAPAFAGDFYWTEINETGSWWGNYNSNWSEYPNLEERATRHPAAGDNVFFDVFAMKNRVSAGVSVGRIVTNMTFQNHYYDNDGKNERYDFAVYNTNGSQVLTVTGDLTKLRGASNGDSLIRSNNGLNTETGLRGGTLELIVEGNVNVGTKTDASTGISGNLVLGGGADGDMLKKLTINGNVNLYNGACLHLSAGMGLGEGSIDNPDIVIKGAIFNTGVGPVNPQITLNYRKGTYNEFISVGGVNGNGVLSNGSEHIGTTTLIFTNAAGTNYKFNGYLNPSNTSGTSHIRVVMNGEGTQTLTTTWYTDKYFIINGAETINGTLLFNSIKNSGDLTFKGGKMGVAKSSVTLSDNTKITLNEINGGNIIWNFGTIVTNIDTDGLAGVFNLTGTIKKGADFYQPVTFEFTGSTNLMIADWVKIITLGEDLTEFSVEDFEANQIVYDGATYEAHFKQEGNDIFAKYVQAVPEPAAFAALLGALALAFTVNRRRK